MGLTHSERTSALAPARVIPGRTLLEAKAGSAPIPSLNIKLRQLQSDCRPSRVLFPYCCGSESAIFAHHRDRPGSILAVAAVVDLLGLGLAMFAGLDHFLLMGLPGPLLVEIGVWFELAFGHHTQPTLRSAKRSPVASARKSADVRRACGWCVSASTGADQRNVA